MANKADWFVAIFIVMGRLLTACALALVTFTIAKQYIPTFFAACVGLVTLHTLYNVFLGVRGR